jgi:type II secretory pathway pseudopilin PulG
VSGPPQHPQTPSETPAGPQGSQSEGWGSAAPAQPPGPPIPPMSQPYPYTYAPAGPPMPPYAPPYPPQAPETSKRTTCLIVAIVLVVVLLMGAVTVATGLPTFLSARARAQNRIAVLALSEALALETMYYGDNGEYGLSGELSAYARRSSPASTYLDFVANDPAPASSGRTQVKVATTSDKQGVCLTVKSRSGTYFAVGELAVSDPTGPQDGTYYFSGTSDPLINCNEAVIASGSTEGYPNFGPPPSRSSSRST